MPVKFGVSGTGGAAYQATLAPRLIGEVAIAGKQKIMEGGVRRQS